jgi:hypothetical protein
MAVRGATYLLAPRAPNGLTPVTQGKMLATMTIKSASVTCSGSDGEQHPRTDVEPGNVRAALAGDAGAAVVSVVDSAGPPGG